MLSQGNARRYSISPSRGFYLIKLLQQQQRGLVSSALQRTVVQVALCQTQFCSFDHDNIQMLRPLCDPGPGSNPRSSATVCRCSGLNLLLRTNLPAGIFFPFLNSLQSSVCLTAGLQWVTRTSCDGRASVVHMHDVSHSCTRDGASPGVDTDIHHAANIDV